LSLSESSLVINELRIEVTELRFKIGKSGFSVNNLALISRNIAVDESDSRFMKTRLVGVEIILVLFSTEERSLESIDSIEKVIIVVSELGSEGNHVLKSSAEVGLLHGFIDLLDHKLVLRSTRGYGKNALEGDGN
jgi:hypothetical protein